MIWDEGPFFDQLPSELESGTRNDSQYKVVGDWLENASEQKVFIPGKKQIEELKCVIKKFETNNKSYSSCFKSNGAWQFATYISESHFNDFINILLTPDDFNRIFNQNTTVALKSGRQGIKVFLTEN